MTPIIVSAMGGGFSIYMRPGFKASIRQMEATKDTAWGPIEREKVTGSVPIPMQRIPMTFPTKAAALASLKQPVAA